MRQPICDLFLKCGGCLYLDIDYLEQLDRKKNKIKYLLSLAKIRYLPEIKVFFKKEYFYRNRMDFVFSEDGLSLREKGKFYKLVPVKKCFIANEKINSLLCEINEWFESKKGNLDIFDIKKRKGTLRYAVLRTSYFLNSNTITFIFNQDSERIDEQKEILFEYCKKSIADNILLGYVKHNSDLSVLKDFEIIKGNEFLKEKLKSFIYYYHSQGFFQNNSSMTEDMMQYIKENINERYNILLDLYGGVGTFGIFLADAIGNVIIADNSKESLQCAEKNIKENNILNAEIKNFTDSTPEFLTEFKNKKSLFILDPPRAGIHKNTLKGINDVLPEKIFYISCNPEQMAKDITFFLEKYNIRDVAIFDMFPQTEHIEAVAVMEKKK